MTALVGELLPLLHRPPRLHNGGNTPRGAGLQRAQRPTWTWVGLRGGWSGSGLGAVGLASWNQGWRRALEAGRIRGRGGVVC